MAVWRRGGDDGRDGAVLSYAAIAITIAIATT